MLPDDSKICGKPILPFCAEDRVGSPVDPTNVFMVVAVYAICCLDPGHEGECAAAKIARLYEGPCMQGEA